MQNKYFWNTWAKPYKYLYLTFLLLFIGALMSMGIAHLVGNSSVLDWNVLAQGDKAEVVIKTFKIGPFNLSQLVESTIFLQKHSGTNAAVNVYSYYIFTGIVSFAVIVLLTIITTLTRFWYYVGIGLFAFFLSSLKFESLLLFGSSQKIGLVIALLLYLPISYVFNNIATSVSFSKRLLVFVLITVLFGGFLYFTAETPNPLFYLSASFYLAAYILALIFIFLVAHEIIALFVYLLFGQSTKSTTNGFMHLMLISIIYLANISIILMHEMNIIAWDMLYIDAFLLLGISAILGIWGYKQRENQYEFIVPFAPFGGYLYLMLGVVCFITIAHFNTTGNDPALEVFSDFILYSHVAFGLIFLLYLLANFANLLKSGAAIYKVVYKPTTMPFFTFRFAGIILVVAFVLRANWQVPVYQGKAAYYNALGDVHHYNGDKLLAERFYAEAALYALNNHKANYNLAKLAEQQKETAKAIVKYKDAISKWPTPQAYVNLSNLYSSENRFFDALFNAREAVKKFPNNPQVLNTLGLIYAKTSVLDSALYYLDKAAKHGQTAATSNIFGLLARENVGSEADSILQNYPQPTDPVGLNNNLVLHNQKGKYFAIGANPTDSALSPIAATMLNNEAINSLFSSDSVNSNKLLAYSRYQGNGTFREGLEYVAYLGQYHNGEVNNAFRRLNWLANTSEKIAAKYFDDLGLWALDQKAYDVAVQYFIWAQERGHQDALLHLAIALSENLEKQRAIENWMMLAQSDDEGVKQMTDQMLKIYALTEETLKEAKESEKYLYARYLQTAQDSIAFEGLLETITDNNYKAKAILDMAQKQWKRNYREQAISTYRKVEGLEISDRDLFEELQYFELKMLAFKADIRGLAQKINQGIDFGQRPLEKAYYSALINHASGDTIAAKKHYDYIAYRNPFFEEAVMAAANFYNGTDAFKAYDILLSAIEVNPNSIALLKAYIEQCARVQQNTSAEIAIERLSKLITKSELDDLKNRYNELVALTNENW